MRSVLPVVVFVFAVPAGAIAGTVAAEGQRRSGQEIFESACVACHGDDGRGQSKSQVGFDLKMLALTDCRFTNREPDSDWVAVIREGGPARAFDPLMPAFGDALPRDEIDRVVAYARGFCKEVSWPRGDLNLPLPLVTEKAFPEDELVATSAVAVQGAGQVANKIIYEQRVGSSSQIELIVPFSSVKRTDGTWSTGIGDVAMGAKQVLFHSLRSGTIASIAGEVILPTGNSDKGLGMGTTVLEPFLAFGQILPANGFVHLQAGAGIPTNGGPVEAFGRMATGMTFDVGRYGRGLSPMVEAIVVRELEDGRPTNVDLVPGLQVTLSTRKHIRAAAGASIPLDDRSRPIQVIAYLLWDWFDGGLLEAW
jgi:mono/diheme cytochrome c family protein